MKHTTTALVNADHLAGGAAYPVDWYPNAQVVSAALDDAHPWILRLIVETTLEPGAELERRVLRGYRDDDAIPTNSTYLGTVIDGPPGSLHIYELHDVTAAAQFQPAPPASAGLVSRLRAIEDEYRRAEAADQASEPPADDDRPRAVRSFDPAEVQS